MSTELWTEYARLQRLAEAGKIRDDHLDHFLKCYIDEGFSFELHDCRRRLKNFDRNSHRTDSHRAALLRRHAFRASSIPVASLPEVAAATAEVRAAVRLSAGDDWPLLQATIDGDYPQLALQMQVPVGTLKARVSRSRARLRGILTRYAS